MSTRARAALVRWEFACMEPATNGGLRYVHPLGDGVDAEIVAVVIRLQALR